MNFIAGKSELPLQEFHAEFIKQRSQYLLRKVKAEKLDELLKNRIPVPAPRTRTHKNPSNPVQSLPTPYPPDSRRMPDPAASLQPYSASPRGSSGGMPVPHFPPPGHPFTPGYAAYSPQNMAGSYQNRPPPIPGYSYNQHRY